MMRFIPIAPILCLLVGAGCLNSSSSDVDPASPPAPITVISPVSVKPPGTVEERVKQAEEFAAKGEYLKAIEKLEEAILIDERDRKVRLLLVKYLLADSRKGQPAPAGTKADPLYEHKQILRARGYLAGLQKYHPDQTDEEKKLASEVLYETARVEAKEMQEGEAFIALRELVGTGFHDFDRIRSDPYWQAFLAQPPYKEEFDKIVKQQKAR
jgi:hypothetical protein